MAEGVQLPNFLALSVDQYVIIYFTASPGCVETIISENRLVITMVDNNLFAESDNLRLRGGNVKRNT